MTSLLYALTRSLRCKLRNAVHPEVVFMPEVVLCDQVVLDTVRCLFITHAAICSEEIPCTWCWSTQQSRTTSPNITRLDREAKGAL